MGFKWVLENFDQIRRPIQSEEFCLPTNKNIRFYLTINSTPMKEVRICVRLKDNQSGKPLPQLKCRLVLLNLDGRGQECSVKETQIDSTLFNERDNLIELKVLHDISQNHSRDKRKLTSWGNTWELICEVTEIKPVNIGAIIHQDLKETSLDAT